MIATTLNLSNNAFEKIIKSIGPNKAHSHDKISVIKTNHKWICKHLELNIF